MIFTHPASQLKEIPATPGVYRFTDAQGQLLYVGKAKDLSQRLKAYFEGREHGPHIKKMVLHIHQLEIIATATELDALLLEQRLISQLKPKYNIIFRDDKTYSYVAITKHKHPQIKNYRGKRNKKVELFGPYVDQGSSRARIEIIQKTFKIRTCDDGTYANRSRPCVLYQIGRCSGPCVEGLVEQADYDEQVDKARSYLAGKNSTLVKSITKEMEAASQELRFEKAAQLRDQIKALSSAQTMQNFEGKVDAELDIIGLATGASKTSVHVYEIRQGLIHDVFAYDLPHLYDAKETIEALFSQHYLNKAPPLKIITEAAELIDQDCLAFLTARWGKQSIVYKPSNPAEINWSAMASDNAKRALESTEKPEEMRAYQQDKLAKLFPNFPQGIISKIECFDISHFQGEAAVASCVVYENFAMRPDQYRIFNIAPENAGDDFASMKEAIIRRYQSMTPAELPQLILIDGGLGQIGKAQEALSLIKVELPMIGIAKGITRKLGNEELFCSWGDAPQRLDKSNPALLLISHIRDESHRFAITRNRKKIAKKRTESQLLEISGIGPQKRKALLLAFGSVSAIREASIEQLGAVPGIGLALAQAIKTRLTY
jgi:excinuclease ABC subunit C